MTQPNHLLTVWNPSYTASAMDEHPSVLLNRAGRRRRRTDPEGNAVAQTP